MCTRGSAIDGCGAPNGLSHVRMQPGHKPRGGAHTRAHAWHGRTSPLMVIDTKMCSASQRVGGWVTSVSRLTALRQATSRHRRHSTLQRCGVQVRRGRGEALRTTRRRRLPADTNAEGAGGRLATNACEGRVDPGCMRAARDRSGPHDLSLLGSMLHPHLIMSPYRMKCSAVSGTCHCVGICEVPVGSVLRRWLYRNHVSG